MIPDYYDPRQVGELFLEDPAWIAKAAPTLPPPHDNRVQAFSTVSLSAGDWLRCAAVGSSVLWLRELSKVAIRVTSFSTRAR
jgi:hypothetical protein